MEKAIAERKQREKIKRQAYLALSDELVEKVMDDLAKQTVIPKEFLIGEKNK